MAARLTEAYEHSVTHDERAAQADVRVCCRNIDIPAGEVLAVEEAPWLDAGLWLGREGHPDVECDDGETGGDDSE